MEIELYKPFAHQRVVHNAISAHIEATGKDSGRFQKTFVVKACRQVGKSALAENELLRFAFTFNGSVNAYLTNSLKLCRKMYKEIICMLEGTNLVAATNASGLVIEFINGSRIEFFSAEQREKLRGFTVSGILVIDEAAFIPDDIYYEKVKVWTHAKQAITLLVSSPDFEKGFFYELHTAGLKGSGYIESFDFNDFDLSVVRPAHVLEEARQHVPPQVFRSEYLGLYKKAEGSVFGDFGKQLLTHEAEAPTELYFGIDFGSGSGGDYTVLSAFNQKRQLCYLWRDNQTPPLEQARQIGSVLTIHKDITKGVYAEQNSIGKIYLDILRKYAHITAFNTDAHSKRKIVEQMQVDIQNGVVWLMDDRELKNEFSMFDMKINSNNHVSYSAPAGQHDDIVMSVLIANWCYKKSKNKTRISFI
ncbi:MAG: terminase family protein [Tannerellaceae bacterium]|nr:terminase family protein [Tannerellaceae bacterium]